MTSKHASASGWKAGDVVWACAHKHNKELTGLLLKQAPVRGILAASRWESSHEYDMEHGDTTPRYFVPFKKGSDSECAWSKAVDIGSRTIAGTYEESVAAYNEAIMSEIKVHTSILNDLYDDLVRTDDGTLATEPPETIWRADEALDTKTLLKTIGADMYLREDAEADIMTLEQFEKMCDAGVINDHDGIGDIRIDGKTSGRTMLCIYRRELVVFDGSYNKYLVPFSRIPELLAGHEFDVLWFNK